MKLTVFYSFILLTATLHTAKQSLIAKKPKTFLNFKLPEHNYETTVLVYNLANPVTSSEKIINILEPLITVTDSCGTITYDAIQEASILEYEVEFYPDMLKKSINKIVNYSFWFMEIDQVKFKLASSDSGSIKTSTEKLVLDQRWHIMRDKLGLPAKTKLRFYCQQQNACKYAKQKIFKDPVTFERNIEVIYDVLHLSQDKTINGKISKELMMGNESFSGVRRLTFLSSQDVKNSYNYENLLRHNTSVNFSLTDSVDDSCHSKWYLIQRRVNNATNFYKTRADYERGFGDQKTNFWKGLHQINSLTDIPRRLRIELWTEKNKFYWTEYSKFKVQNQETDFVMTVGAMDPQSSAGDALSGHSGARFSTYDVDKDSDSFNCAHKFKGAWWFRKCSKNLNPNGEYQTGVVNATAVYWKPINNNHKNLKEIRFLILRD